MLSLDKILGLAGMGSAVVNAALLKRFLSGIAVVVALTAISSTMASMLLIVGFYELYVILLHHGLDQTAASLTVCSLAAAVVIITAVLAASRWYQLREMPQLLFMELPVVNRASKLAEAFFDGLMAERKPRR